MQQKTIIGLSGLAVALLMAVPAIGFAKSKTKPMLTNPTALDATGDNNGLAQFKKHSVNGKLKQVVGTVTAMTAPVVTPKTDGTITVKTAAGKTYTFSFDSTSATKYTTFLRKFKGTATWNEIAVGDSVHVFAKKLVGGRAIIVWDKGIWWSEVKGTMSAIDATNKTFTLTVTMNKVEFTTTVKTDTSTVFVQDTTTKAFTDLAVGSKVKVRGAWDVAGKFLLAKRIVIGS